jgi:hypothetical protein
VVIQFSISLYPFHDAIDVFESAYVSFYASTLAVGFGSSQPIMLFINRTAPSHRQSSINLITDKALAC